MGRCVRYARGLRRQYRLTGYERHTARRDYRKPDARYLRLGSRALFGVNAAAGWLSGDAFDRRLGFNINAYRYIGDSATVGIAWYYDDISEGDDIFAGIAGKRSHLIARYRWFSSDGRRVLVRLRHEENDRRDPGGL